MSERWKPSVTVAAVVERRDADEPRYLLVEEHTPEGLRLNNPAGHLDPGESPEEGVIREALEETARVYTPDRIVGVYLSRRRRTASGEDVTYLRIAFGGSVGPADPARRLDDGIVGTLWMTRAEVQASRARHRSPLVLRCIDDHAAGRRFPLDLLQCDPSVYAPATEEP
jgi:8-oxo-dGTP pyrophosphatase MutT (NUDIX family)